MADLEEHGQSTGRHSLNNFFAMEKNIRKGEELWIFLICLR